MYKCENCEREFDEPKTAYDFSTEYFGRPVNHYISICPFCGSDDFEEMEKCDVCGEWVDPDEELCPNCKELIEDMAYEIRDKVREKTIIHKLNYDEFISHLLTELDK